MKKYDLFDWLALCLLVLGGLNWGVVGLFRVNLIDAAMASTASFARIIYTIIGASAIYLLLSFAIPPDDTI